MQERVAIGFRCSHCARPLPLRKTGIVACAGCGGENYVEFPPGADRPASSDRLLFGVVLGALGATALATALGVAAFVWIRLRAVRTTEPGLPQPPPSLVEPSDPLETPPPSAPPEPRSRPAGSIVSWVGSGNGGPPCLADVDGDGVPDMVGFGTTLMAVGTVSGSVVWESPAASGGLTCDGHSGIVLTDTKDFSIRGVDPRSGAGRWSVKLPDAPRSVSFGDGCLVATAIDDSRTSLALVSGSPAPCPSAPPERPRSGLDHAPLSAAGLQISFSTVPKGSPRIVVAGSRGATKVWEQTLELAIEHLGDVPHALSAAGLLIAGKQPGSEKMGVVLLDPATGNVLSSREIVQKQSHPALFVHLVATEQHAFLQTFGKLYALRLPDLAVRWEAGSMW